MKKKILSVLLATAIIGGVGTVGAKAYAAYINRATAETTINRVVKHGLRAEYGTIAFLHSKPGSGIVNGSSNDNGFSINENDGVMLPGDVYVVPVTITNTANYAQDVVINDSVIKLLRGNDKVFNDIREIKVEEYKTGVMKNLFDVVVDGDKTLDNYSVRLQPNESVNFEVKIVVNNIDFLVSTNEENTPENEILGVERTNYRFELSLDAIGYSVKPN